MITSHQEGYEFLEKLYSPWKLSRMGLGVNRTKYSVERVILEHCYGALYNEELRNQIDEPFLLDLCCEFAENDEIVNLAKFLIENNSDEIFKGKLLNKICQDSGTFRKKITDMADILWDNTTHETKMNIMSNVRCDNTWGNRGQERIFYFFYLKGFINFTEPSLKKWDINRLHDIPNLSIEFLKKVKINYTDDVIKNVLKNHRKDYKRRIEYLFTLPELREKFIDNPDWMFFDVGFGKFIDYYPEEERQKYIKVLLKKYKKERKQKQNNDKLKTNQK